MLGSRVPFENGLKRYQPANLFLVCRQIHSEAVLLPFQVNEFAYHNPDVFHQFVDKLSEQQRDTIKIVRMDIADFENAFEALSKFWTEDKHPAYDVYRPLAKLTGLQHVRCMQKEFEQRDARVRGPKMAAAREGTRQLGTRDGADLVFIEVGMDFVCITVPQA